MQRLFIIVVAASLLAALSAQQANAQYGDNVPMGPGGSISSETMLQRCAELEISRIQCNQASILQAERIELITESEVKGSGTSMIATDSGQMAGFLGALGVVFGSVAAAFYVIGGKRRKVSA